jgi:hypothetical protein
MNSANVENLSNSATNTFDQLQRAAAPAIKEGKRQAGILRDQGGELFDSVTNQASETASDIGKSLIAYTKKNPLIALLLAVGAGALLVSASKSMRSRD